MKIDANNLPQKIKDGCILDAIVTLQFQTEYNQSTIEETLEGKLNKNSEENRFARIPVIEKGLILEDKVFFANDTFRVMIDKNKISFNIVKAYPSWERYRSFVRYVVDALLEKINITNVDVRYRSHFGNVPLFKNVDGNFSFKYLQSFMGAQYSFHCNVTDEVPGRIPALASVVLTDRREVAPSQIESIVDISVINRIDQGVALDDIMRSLDFIHLCQKHLFFTIISDEFYECLKV